MLVIFALMDVEYVLNLPVSGGKDCASVGLTQGLAVMHDYV